MCARVCGISCWRDPSEGDSIEGSTVTLAPSPCVFYAFVSLGSLRRWISRHPGLTRCLVFSTSIVLQGKQNLVLSLASLFVSESSVFPRFLSPGPFPISQQSMSLILFHLGGGVFFLDD